MLESYSMRRSGGSARSKGLRPGSMEAAVDFKNDGRRLFGILHTPEGVGQNQWAVNLLCPGLKHRVGPHRLNVKIARLLCSMGFPVLRFDPHGLGDSEGSLPSGPLWELWRSVLLGRYVADSLAANEFLKKETGSRLFSMGGLCGGAVTALITAERDERVHSLFMVDPLVRVMGKEVEFIDMINAGEFSNTLFKNYLRKIRDPRSIWRLLTFQSDTKAIVKLIRTKAIKTVGGSIPQSKGTMPSSHLNPGFLKAFQSCVQRNVKMLFVLAQNDYSTGEFEQDFEEPVLRRDPKALGLSTVHKILGANHTYTLPEWQEQLFKILREFLTEPGFP